MKKTIMTEAYGISFIVAKLNFFKEKNFKKELTEEEFKELEKTFKDFFIYLKTNPLLFKESPVKIINSIVNEDNFNIILNNGECANLVYFKPKIIQKSYYINTQRHTKKTQILTTNVDKITMRRAIRANYVQLQESAVARYVGMKTHSPIVHDCFSIDYLNVPFIISLVNEAMNINFHDLKINKDNFEFFSIFIIL